MKISAIIPTCEVTWNAGITFQSLPELTRKPDEIVVVMDGDEDKVEETSLAGVPVKIVRTQKRGAAAKRNLGVEKSSGDSILFVDDDVEFNSESLGAMEHCLIGDDQIGGIWAFIRNQSFRDPGIYSRAVYWLCGGWGIRNFGGKCVGPMINFYPKPWTGGEPFHATDWLSTCCVLYRRKALPTPPFEAGFTGYSFMEDVALSRRVRKKWKIGAARDAWVIHHSKPAAYKSHVARLYEMGIVNRFHILTEVEGWGGMKAAWAISWLELLMLPSRIREALKEPKKIKAFSGIVAGLTKIWQRILQTN